MRQRVPGSAYGARRTVSPRLDVNEPLFCRGEAMIARPFLFVNSEYTSHMQISR